MDYQRFAHPESTEFKITAKTILFGGTTWQIRNIAATQIKRVVLEFDEPEPKFYESRPEFQINIKAMLISAAIAGIIAFGASNQSWLGILGFVGVIAGFIFIGVKTQENEVAEWAKRKEAVDRQWAIWNEIKQNPPIIYTLMLETNAGSKPLFHSFNQTQMENVNNAIINAMENPGDSVMQLNIDAINIGSEDSINNFGSTVYRQSINNGV